MCKNMRLTKTLSVMSLALAGMIAAAPAAAQSRIDDLNWIDESGTYVLRDSNGSIRIGGGMALVLGDQARRGMYLIEGVESPQTEAVLYNYDDEVAVIFEFFPTGYVRDQDWATIDADALMREIVASTEQTNRQSRSRGHDPLRVTGWISEPSYDRRSHSVSMSLAAESNQEKIVNVSVLKLGRLGYEKITWVGSADQYGWSDRMLDKVVDNHSFDPGYRYADYREGDSVSGVELAGLVAAVATSKASPGGILRLLRKGWVLILMAIGALAAGARWMFGSR